MQLRTLLLTLLLATSLGCSGSKKPTPTPSASGTPSVSETAAPNGSDPQGSTTGSHGTKGDKKATGSEGGRLTVIGQHIKSKPMNVSGDKDRLFQNGPTREEIARFRARQEAKRRGRTTQGRGGHNQPVFNDNLEEVKG